MSPQKVQAPGLRNLQGEAFMFRKCLSLQVSQTWSLYFLRRHVWHSLWPWLGTETSCNGSRPGASISATTPPGWSTTGGERNGYSQRYTRRSGNPPVGLWGTDALFLLCFLLFPFCFSFSIFLSLLRSGRGRGRWVPSFGLLLTAGLRQAEPWS